MSDFSFEIVERIGVLSTNPSGWTKEFNIVAYNGGAPKYDIRDWSPDHKKMGKGITLTKDEAQVFAAMVASMYFEERDSEEIEEKKVEKPEAKVLQFKPKVEKVEKKEEKPKAKKEKQVAMNGVKLPF